MATETASPAAPNATSRVSGKARLRRLIEFNNKVKARFMNEGHIYVSFYDTISLAEEKGIHWVYWNLDSLFHDHRDLIVELSGFLKALLWNPKKRRTSMTESIRIGGSGNDEDDSIDDIIGTPSYPFPPFSEKGQPKSREGKVLNKTLVCKPLKGVPSSDGGVIRNRNRHAEILALSEDEMYESDMLVSVARSTIERIRELLPRVLRNSNRRAAVRVEDHLTPGNLRCIEKIYGHMGEEMLECVRKDPERALPRLLSRLEQKEKEWRMLHAEVTEGFKEALVRHHGPSLGRGPSNFSGEAPAGAGHGVPGSSTPLFPLTTLSEVREEALEGSSDTTGSAAVEEERLGGELSRSLSLLLEIAPAAETEKPFLFGKSLSCLLRGDTQGRRS